MDSTLQDVESVRNSRAASRSGLPTSLPGASPGTFKGTFAGKDPFSVVAQQQSASNEDGKPLEITSSQDLLFTSETFKNKYTSQERRDLLASLWDNPSTADLEALSFRDTQHKLLSLALRDNSQGAKAVRRFDGAFIQTLLDTQHEIVKLEEKMSQDNYTIDDTGRMSRLLIDYASLIKSYKDLAVFKKLGLDESRMFAKLLATELHEPRYWYAPDAFDLLELQVKEVRGTHDIVRKFLQQKLPVSFLDRVGRERRELDEMEPDREEHSSKVGRVSKLFEEHRRRGRYISPSVDNFARVLFALLGGVFLLAPMVVMAYINSKHFLLLTTVIFVLLFAVILGLATKASNQELVGATAAYAAVLVVFVGNSIGPGETG